MTTSNPSIDTLSGEITLSLVFHSSIPSAVLLAILFSIPKKTLCPSSEMRNGVNEVEVILFPDLSFAKFSGFNSIYCAVAILYIPILTVSLLCRRKATDCPLSCQVKSDAVASSFLSAILISPNGLDSGIKNSFCLPLTPAWQIMMSHFGLYDHAVTFPVLW
ncbi:hypothetical protein D3C72_1019360 [compost metagenome]